jgi:hypothetical protein
MIIKYHRNKVKNDLDMPSPTIMLAGFGMNVGLTYTFGK